MRYSVEDYRPPEDAQLAAGAVGAAAGLLLLRRNRRPVAIGALVGWRARRGRTLR